MLRTFYLSGVLPIQILNRFLFQKTKKLHLLLLVQVTEERDCLRKRLETIQQLNHQLEEELTSSKTSLTEAMDESRELKRKLHTVQGLVDAGERKRGEQMKEIQQQVNQKELHTLP